MANGCVVLVGDLPVEHLSFDHLVAQFGWSVKRVDSLRSLATLSVDSDLVTVLFDPKILALPWDKALRSIMIAAPGAMPILCHGFAEAIDSTQVAEAGAFHFLLVPFNASEVRQSLGFVWGAQRPPAPVRPQCLPRRHRAIREGRTPRQSQAVA